MSLIKKVIFLFLGWLIILIPFLLITELFLRISNDEWRQAEQLNIIRDTELSYRVDHLYKADYSEINYTRDEFGLRGNCRNASDIDILTVGGSTTDQRYVDDKFTFQTHLSQNLSVYLGKEICVSNAGVDGHSTFGHISSFKDWFPNIKNLKPKYYLLYLGINDADFINNRPRAGYDDQSQEGIKSFLKKIELVKVMIRFRNIIDGLSPMYAYGKHTKSIIEADKYSVTEISKNTKALTKKNADMFERRLKDILIRIKLIGSQPICVTQPHRFIVAKSGVGHGFENVFSKENIEYSGLDFDFSLQEINKRIKKVCGDKNTIDLYSQMFSNSDFYDFLHTTPEGSKRIGNLLAKKIIESSLIDKL